MIASVKLSKGIHVQLLSSFPDSFLHVRLWIVKHEMRSWKRVLSICSDDVPLQIN